MRRVSLCCTPVDCVMVDEVHERGLDCDFLLLVLRDLVKQRRHTAFPLKVVLMSATIDASEFLNYFTVDPATGAALASNVVSAALFEIPGRTNFPIQEYWIDDLLQECSKIEQGPGGFRFRSVLDQKKLEPILGKGDEKNWSAQNWWETGSKKKHEYDPSIVCRCVEYISYIDPEPEGAAILIFAPGWREIQDTVKALEQLMMRGPSMRFEILRLHSTVPKHEQNRIFQRPPRGVRKVIVGSGLWDHVEFMEGRIFVSHRREVVVKAFYSCNVLVLRRGSTHAKKLSIYCAPIHTAVVE